MQVGNHIQTPLDLASASINDSLAMRDTPVVPSELESVGTQFESVFMSLLVNQMRQSSASGMFEGEGSDTMGGLFDMFLGQHLAEAGGLGIKQMLVSRYAQQASAEMPPAALLDSVYH